MPRKTKLLKLSTEQISKLKKDELEKLLRTSIRYSYKKHRELEASGRKSDYNEVFKSIIGKTEYQALKQVPDLSLNQMRKRLGYIRRNLLSDKSTLEGVRKKEEQSLKIISDLLSTPVEFERSGDDYKATYKVDDRYETQDITANDLSEFWSIVRKVDEDHTLTLYGSGEGINFVFQEFFGKDNKDPLDILNSLKEKKEEQDYKEALAELERYQRRKQSKFKGTVK